MAAEKSFWGLIVKPDKRYEQVVEESFHISKACLEPNSAGKGVTSVSIEVESEEFLLCNLQSSQLSDSLDLNFVAGEKICFKTEGSGIVHLSGYLIPDDEDIDPYMMSDDDDLDEMEDEEEEVPALVNGQNKRKGSQELSSSPQKKSKAETPLDKALAEKKKGLKGPQNEADVKAAVKKAEEMQKKIALEAEKMKKKKAFSQDSDEGDSSDDDEDEMDELEEEEDDDEDDDDGSDDDLDDEEESEDDEEDEPTPVKAKGDGKTPEKKNAKQQQQQSASNKNSKAPQANGTPTSDGKPGKKNKGQETPAKQATNDKAAAKGTPAKTGETPKKIQKTPKRTLKGGVVVEDLKEGSGPEAKRGKMIGMFYEGRLATNNKRFDAKQSGEPFKFKLGLGEVIKGWDVGIEGMKVGGKRLLTIPPKMAYGNDAQSGIPANSTLVFEVECKFVS